MKKRSHDFRQQAKDALQGNWFIAIIAGIIASFFGAQAFYGGGVSFEFSVPSGGSGSGMTEEELQLIFGELSNSGITEVLSSSFFMAYLAFVSAMVIFASVWNILRLIFGGAIGIGYSNFNLDLIEGRKAKLSTLFGSMKQLINGLLANILRGIFVTLWSLLFFIPGIIANYSYAMVHYVMADNPGISASDAIAESKRLMKGNKWRLFCLNLSFFGWVLLAALFTFGIGFLWLIPYQEAAYAAFYRDICPAKTLENAA